MEGQLSYPGRVQLLHHLIHRMDADFKKHPAFHCPFSGIGALYLGRLCFALSSRRGDNHPYNCRHHTHLCRGLSSGLERKQKERQTLRNIRESTCALPVARGFICYLYISFFSCLSSHILTSTPPEKPHMEPFDAIILWQGRTIGRGFFPSARPVALSAFGLPIFPAIHL